MITETNTNIFCEFHINYTSRIVFIEQMVICSVPVFHITESQTNKKLMKSSSLLLPELSMTHTRTHAKQNTNVK